MNIMEKCAKKFKGERTFSTIVIIVFMVAFWFFAWSPVFKPVFVSMTALIAALGTYELIRSVKCESKLIYAISMVYSAVEVFLTSYSDKIETKWNVILSVYAIVLLVVMVPLHEKVKYIHISMALVASVFYSFSFSCFILIREFYLYNGKYDIKDCFFLFLLAFGASWVTDAGAFLVGRKFGKHKLCPKISPKKSVEGAIGGLVFDVVMIDIAYTVYSAIISSSSGYKVLNWNLKSYVVISLISVLLGVLSMFGDLSASVHKRHFGLKDYSNILPGHGGILDRFDSTIFVLPALYAVLSLVDNLFV